MQNPIVAYLCPLKRLASTSVAPSSDRDVCEARLGSKHEFAMDCCVLRGSHTLPSVPIEEVQVITHLAFEKQGVVCSIASAVGLQAFLDTLPESQIQTQSSSRSQKVASISLKSRDRDIREFP